MTADATQEIIDALRARIKDQEALIKKLRKALPEYPPRPEGGWTPGCLLEWEDLKAGTGCADLPSETEKRLMARLAYVVLAIENIFCYECGRYFDSPPCGDNNHAKTYAKVFAGVNKSDTQFIQDEKGTV